MTGEEFVSAEQKAHAAFFARTVAPEVIYDQADYRLKSAHRLLNLAPAIRDLAFAYFGPPRDIVWHQYANHGLSSQACCLNFLMPLATLPELLGRVIGSALGLDGITVLPFETDPDEKPWYIGFEWIGLANYIGEWPGDQATRGANVTSADAAVRFQHNSAVQTVLIEWKYTERYDGQPIGAAGNPTRKQRYSDKAFAPNGPMRADLGLKLEDFFWEPLYQLLREQMLAWQMERAKENGAERVSVLHISPAANTALHRVTAPALRGFGDDVFNVFRSLLVTPESFHARTTEQVFGPFLDLNHSDRAARHWAAYLRDRYRFLSPPGDGKA